jgi:hypothetical protein
MTVADLQNWRLLSSTYFTKIGLKNVDSLIVSQPKYDYFRVGFKENKVNDWKAYALVIIKQSFKSIVNYNWKRKLWVLW